MIRFNGIHHLALATRDMDGTIRFWSMANRQVALTLIHDGGPVLHRGGERVWQE